MTLVIGKTLRAFALRTTTLGFLGVLLLCPAPSFADSYFEADVWADPRRPFLFYGEAEDTKNPEKKAAEKEENLPPQTVTELKTRVEETLERAVMDPTDENIARYLKINALLLEKAGRFAERWRDVLINYPEYDWTASHPTANFASTTLSRERDAARGEKLMTLAGSWGLVYFGDSGRLTGLMRPLVDRFAGMTGMELVKVAVGGKSPYLREAYVDTQLHKRAAGGIKHLPALLLMHKDDGDIGKARLVATGVVDIAELGRRVVRLVSAYEEQGNFEKTSISVTHNRWETQ